jgi:osmoprotectant transport system permease protein
MRIAVALLIFISIHSAAIAADDRVTVGSKAFGESWILGEAATFALQRAGLHAEHKRNLGGTQIAYEALRSGDIDLYPEYTGTIQEVILHSAQPLTLEEMRAQLRPQGIDISAPLGFDNSYALAASPALVQRCDLKKISDLARCAAARWGLSHEFIGRADGWSHLREIYRLDGVAPRAMQHELAYEAIRQGSLDVVDVYTTDPQIEDLHLSVLQDDAHFFPRYDAVLLFRSDLPTRFPNAQATIDAMSGVIDQRRMRTANAALQHGRTLQEAASALVGMSAISPSAESGWAREIAIQTARHLQLVAISLLLAILVGVPTGVVASRFPRLGAVLLSASAVLQTIPSLALLALLIPLFGVGAIPALIALFLYSLLPIVRNTCTGMANIPRPLLDSATVIGLAPAVRLWRIELPLASPVILAGIRTSAVVNVGTATIAAFIGAGGLGSLILQGIALRDTQKILEGAIPTALLALCIDGVFALLSARIIPKGLQRYAG